MDPQVGEPPSWRGGRETRELFAQGGDIWDGEDNLIAVVALQETSLDRGITEHGQRVKGYVWAAVCCG